MGLATRLLALTTALGTAAGAADSASAVAPAARAAAAAPLADDLFSVACVSPKNCLAVAEGNHQQ